MTIALRAYPGRFRELKRGQRTHLYARDRGFSDGDRIIFQEWDPADDESTGDELAMSVTSITRGPDEEVPKGYVVLSIAAIQMPIHVPGDLAEERRRRDRVGTENL